MADFSEDRNISISQKLKGRKSIGRKGHIAESEPKDRSGPSLVRAPFGLMVALPFGEAESSNDRFEAYFRKINFGILCNIRPFEKSVTFFRLNFFTGNEFRPIILVIT
jgi:hypothetical protein